MRLLIIRHAIAVPRGAPDLPDEERPLTPRGERRFTAAALGLARIIPPPTALLTSPLTRAHETAVIAARALGGPAIAIEPALASGSFDDLAKALAAYGDKDTVAVFGHEPHLSALLARLLGSRRADKLTFRKGGAALLEIPGPLAEGGSLIWYLPPRILRALT